MPWVTDEEIRAAREMTAIEYLRRYEPDRLKKSSARNEWELTDHDSFIGATKAGHFDDAADAFAVKLTTEDIAYLEEPYLPHRIVGAIDHNHAEGVMLLDEKK